MAGLTARQISPRCQLFVSPIDCYFLNNVYGKGILHGTRGFSQSYLLSRIVRNAQRSTKVPFFIREIGVNTLRWPKSFSVILQITGPTPFSATLRSLAQVSPQRLPSCRSLSRSSLCHRDRNWPDREYSGADSQWTNPTASGSARVSTPRHFEELSLAFWSQRTPRSGGRSRPTTSGTLLSSGSSLQRHYRCRHHSAYHLWLSRRYRCRICPQEAPQPAFLRSDHLQRGENRFEFGHGTQSRQCARFLWSLGFPQASPGQIAFLDRFHAHTGASRWSFLRQKHRPVSRYKEFARGWEAAQFSYTPLQWREEHRFVAVRRPIALETEEIQQRLFTFKKYTYHRALVTNLELTAAAVWRFYCDRGFQELLLREFKGSYAMAKIPTRSLWANAAYMETILWAYDLVLAFQFLCLPEEVRHWNIATLRRELWWLPAEWIKRDNRNLLMLPSRYPRQNLFLKIQHATTKVRALI